MNQVPAVSQGTGPGPPLASIIVLNYNGARWLERCLNSLRKQTILDQLEIIVADNASPDGSDKLAARIMEGWPNARVIQNGGNFGYCEGNNRAAQHAQGRYLFFLNNDTWLEPDCMERLLGEVQNLGASAASPLVLDYEDQTVQSTGASGFDVFGLLSSPPPASKTADILVASGCAFLVESALFARLGGFDNQFFMYADEYDLSWRIWAAGGRIILASTARLHHRGAASVNPQGQTKMVETRTSDTTRFYANRNNLLVVLKNSSSFLLFMFPLQILSLLAESIAFLLLSRRWSSVRRAYFEAIKDCWRLRRHVAGKRREMRGIRQHGDFWMLRFLRWRLSRLDDLKRFKRFGIPKVDAR
jgi:GT2 family glycosyltransferase